MIFLLGKERQVGRYFLLEHFLLFHCFLALIISLEMLVVRVVIAPLTVNLTFLSLTAFRCFLFLLFFWSLFISSFIIMHLGVVFFVFILLGVCDASCIYRLMASSLHEKYSISHQLLYLLYSLAFLLLGLQLHIHQMF